MSRVCCISLTVDVTARARVSIQYLIVLLGAVDTLFIVCIGLPSQFRLISRCFWGHPVIPASYLTGQQNRPSKSIATCAISPYICQSREPARRSKASLRSIVHESVLFRERNKFFKARE